jgi:hypothetical protein
MKKQAFIKILNKMLQIKLRINNYNNKKQSIAKRFLFQILLSNVNYMKIQQSKIYEIIKKANKRRFLQFYKTNFRISYNQQKVGKNLIKLNKKYLIEKIKDKINLKK